MSSDRGTLPRMSSEAGWTSGNRITPKLKVSTGPDESVDASNMMQLLPKRPLLRALRLRRRLLERALQTKSVRLLTSSARGIQPKTNLAVGSTSESLTILKPRVSTRTLLISTTI